MVVCECCGNTTATETIEPHQHFEINVPVVNCNKCGLSYTDNRCEELIERHIELKVDK